MTAGSKVITHICFVWEEIGYDMIRICNNLFEQCVICRFNNVVNDGCWKISVMLTKVEK